MYTFNDFEALELHTTQFKSGKKHQRDQDEAIYRNEIPQMNMEGQEVVTSRTKKPGAQTIDQPVLYRTTHYRKGVRPVRGSAECLTLLLLAVADNSFSTYSLHFGFLTSSWRLLPSTPLLSAQC